MFSFLPSHAFAFSLRWWLVTGVGAGLLWGVQFARAEEIAGAGGQVGSPVGAPDPGQPSPWKGRMTASLSLESGNSRSREAQVDVDVARKKDGGKTTLTAQVSESQSGARNERETTAGRWGGTAQHDRDVDADHFAFARMATEHDRVIDLQVRAQAAVGLGRHLISEADRSFDVFAGLGRTVSRYRREKTIAGETDSRFASNILLIGNEYTHQFSPTVNLKQRLEGYLAIDGDRNHLYKLSAALNVDMTRTLALTVALTDTYNSRVAADQKRNNLSLTTGISVRIGS
jgi:putative salt-induced outer membrane protein YdiY